MYKFNFSRFLYFWTCSYFKPRYCSDKQTSNAIWEKNVFFCKIPPKWVICILDWTALTWCSGHARYKVHRQWLLVVINDDCETCFVSFRTCLLCKDPLWPTLVLSPDTFSKQQVLGQASSSWISSHAPHWLTLSFQLLYMLYPKGTMENYRRNVSSAQKCQTY